MGPKTKSSASKSKEEWMTCPGTDIRYHISDAPVFQALLETADKDKLESLQVDVPHIKDSTFVSRVQCGGKKQSLGGSPADKWSSLYLPQQVARLCGLGFGGHVLVAGPDFSLVLRAYIHNVSQNNSILVDPESILLHKLRDCPQETLVQVNKFQQDVRTAKQVQVELECSSSRNVELLNSSSSSEVETRQLLPKLHAFLLNKIVASGASFPFHYFGKSYATKIFFSDQARTTGDNLSDCMTALSLDQGKKVTKEIYFTVTSATILDVVKKESADSSSGETKLSKVGGLDKQLKFLVESCQSIFSESATRCVNGVLLYGPPGVGKTLLAQTLCSSVGCSQRVISGAELYSKFYGETEAKVRQVFEESVLAAPCVLVLEDLDTMAPKKEGASLGDQERRILSTLQTCLDRLRQNRHRVFVVATTNKLDSVPATLRRPGRLDTELELSVPDAPARYDILNVFLEDCKHNLTSEEVDKIAKETHGFVGADLSNLFAISLALATKEARELTLSDFEQCRAQVKPSAMREVQVEVPSVTWQHIGGLADLKLKLNQSVDWPTKRPELFTRMGIKPPRGILMYGPPGCSKTMIAKALANESGLNFLTIKGPELFSKWVGESEKAVRDLFRRARNVAPSIVFFDEIDALGASRGGSGSSRVAERVLAQLLTEMDGVDSLVGVTVVAATNRPDMMDPALLRPGRLDRVIYVPLPDLDTRKQVLKINTRSMPLENVDLDEIARKTDGYSGAEVCAVCNEAALAALEEEAEVVTENHFLAAINIVKPRIKPELLQIYAEFQNKHR